MSDIGKKTRDEVKSVKLKHGQKTIEKKTITHIGGGCMLVLLLLVLLLSAQVEKTKPLEPETFLTFDYEMNEHEPRSQEKNKNFRLLSVLRKSFRFAKKFSPKKNSSCKVWVVFPSIHCGFS